MSKLFNRLLMFLVAAAVTALFLLPESSELPINNSDAEELHENMLPSTIEKQEILSPGALSIHFPDERATEITAQLEQIELMPEPEPEEPHFSSSMQFISSVVRNGYRSWFFKDKSTGRMYDLAPGADSGPWKFISDEGDFFLLKYNEIIYKVRK